MKLHLTVIGLACWRNPLIPQTSSQHVTPSASVWLALYTFEQIGVSMVLCKFQSNDRVNAKVHRFCPALPCPALLYLQCVSTNCSHAEPSAR